MSVRGVLLALLGLWMLTSGLFVHVEHTTPGPLAYVTETP